MFCTYILKSLSNGKYYIGSCDDINERIKKHNSGNVKSTKNFIPWKIVHKEFFGARGSATKRERQLKSWKSRKALEKLFKEHF